MMNLNEFEAGGYMYGFFEHGWARMSQDGSYISKATRRESDLLEEIRKLRQELERAKKR